MLVNDLLNTARLEDGRLVGVRQPTDIIALMQSTIDNAKTAIAKKGHTIIFTPPKEKLPLLVLDSETMSLAFQNLLENAIRYTKPRGNITVTMEPQGDKLRVAVADNGVGVPEDQQERVFTKFFRGKNVLSMETEGSGLGLFIAKNIVETHGGGISFSSAEGKGTTVTITLPLSSVDKDALPSPLSFVRPPAQKKSSKKVAR